MKRVNLLPRSLLSADERKRRRYQYLLLIGVFSAVIVAGGIWTYLYASSLDTRIRIAEENIAPLRDQIRVVDDIERENTKLRLRLDAFEGMRDPVSASAILALITRSIPDDVTLQRLSIDIPPPADPALRGGRNVGIRAASIQFDAAASASTSVPAVVKGLDEASIFKNIRVAQNRKGASSESTRHLFQVTAEIQFAAHGEGHAKSR